ncbi:MULTISPECIES: DUF3000 domain-containing protein [Microbacterium]|uniref:DUF3000 domain-containing protein n=1 Tax=Microbacterium paraoxydans TaxID=199592 RepID=A0ABZ2HTS3_9MICO|nr:MULTISPECIES: DUF3000 domain-containing protein [Microbacterium]AMG84610.1 hypothetical protein AXH82_15315 [Microbacterium sp. PAMC 28756]AVL97236.1 DUF3000 domain-containing protein [Microbacterium sp. str. 'China']KYJ99041.1 hypothetical protein AUV07_09245 [Microbacterium sp. CH1]MCT1396511.1 DUF3000 domain-containing protein [Microbacterium sp. p3-SID338]MPT13704.1 DUF3000 domain-containing protein [Microbacterium sp.]
MTAHPEAGTPFDAAVAELRATAFRDDIAVREIPTPQNLAPFAIALSADVRPGEDGDSVYGTGRFILLHDPDEPDAWGGAWRIVIFAQAPLETEIGTDPLLADVTWSWLVDALDSRDAIYHSPSGTSTKTLSKGFGGLADEGDGAQIELRASWTPEGPFRPHVEAWAELVGMLAGLPPGSEGIAVIGARKAVRD